MTSTDKELTMTATIDIHLDHLVELDEREGDGLRVTMIWNRATGRVSVLVQDERTEEAFAIEVPETGDPLDVFRHPFAYAAQRPAAELPVVTCATCA